MIQEVGGLEHAGVIDAVRLGLHGMQQREHLAAQPVMTWTVTEVDEPIDHLLDP